MAQLLDRLSALKATKLTKPGMYLDGGGLYLQVTAGKTMVAKSWVFRFKFKGRQRDMGLGPASVLGLADARERAKEARRLLLEGIDPLEARNAARVRTLNTGVAFPAAFSISGPALLDTGNYIQSASLFPGFDLSPDGLSAWPAAAATARAQALNDVLTFDNGLTMVQAANQVRQNAVTLNGLLKSAGSTAPLTTVFPGTTLGSQMQQVAEIIKLRTTTGISRQVFFCSLSGFDTHSGQSWQQWDLFGQVSDAMRALYDATLEMGIADKVTTFTETDFGRTLQPSGTGTDHGWGGHNLVLGGAVRGGDIYGTFPMPALGGPDDANTRGVLIPTTSLDQYGATLASWFGVTSDALTQVFPNIGKFATANVGFLG